MRNPQKALGAGGSRMEGLFMKFDDHLVAGLFIGITIGLHYGGTLTPFMPIFLVLGLLYLLRFVKIN
jgi:hypothetical protein